MKEKNDNLPLYLQLREEVRRKIENGEYVPGTAIPSEKQLADAHGMHRLSVRNALKALIREGLLKSMQGKGIFVCGPRKPETTEGFQLSPEELDSIAEHRVLIKTTRKAGPYYSKLLGIDPEDSVWFVRRIISSKGEPVALKDIIVPTAKLPGLEEIDLQLFSLYDALTWSSVHLYSGEQVLRMTYLDPSMARLLNLSPNQAVMEISCVIRDPEETVAAYSCSYIRGDKTGYSLHYKCNESDRVDE